jgi:hypothetical protein
MRCLPACIMLLALSFEVSCGDAEVKGPAVGGRGMAGAVTPERPNGAAPPSAGDSGGEIVLADAGAPAAPPASAAPMQCAAEAHKTEIVPLELMLLVDSSESMNDLAGTRSMWQTAQAALSSFVSDPKSAGLGVGLQFFPQEQNCTTDADCFPSAATQDRYCRRRQVCTGPAGPDAMAVACGPKPFVIVGPTPVAVCPTGSTCQPLGQCTLSGTPCSAAGVCVVPSKTCAIGAANSCSEASYQFPSVPIRPLPMGQMPLTRTIGDRRTSGGTPMGPAVRGVLAHLRARLAADPARKVALILATDGLPGGCAASDIPTVAADLTAAFTAAPSIPTYVIGVFTPAELVNARPKLDQLAKGGGTNQAFVLSATDDLNVRLLQALDQIRGAAALACEYRIPTPQAGNLDFAKVNVRHIRPAGPENIPYVERIDRCDPMRGGWYYDVNPSMGTPTRVIVCPTTCNAFKSDPGGGVELAFGCATQTID